GGGRDLEQGEHRQGEQHGRLLRKRGWSGAFRTAIMLRGRGSGASLASPSRGSAAACCRRRSGSAPSTPHLSIDIYIDSYLYAQMSDIFQWLADPSRRRLVELLRDGERSVGELVEASGASQPTVS